MIPNTSMKIQNVRTHSARRSAGKNLRSLPALRGEREGAPVQADCDPNALAFDTPPALRARLQKVADVVGLSLEDYIAWTLSAHMDDVHDGRRILDADVFVIDYPTRKAAKEAALRAMEFDQCGNYPVGYDHLEDGTWRVVGKVMFE